MRTALSFNRVATLSALAALAAMIALAFLLSAASAQGDTAIGYDTPAAALEDLRSKPGVEISTQGGYIIVAEPATSVLWTFTDTGHPAHPTAVRRQVVEGLLCHRHAGHVQRQQGRLRPARGRFPRAQ